MRRRFELMALNASDILGGGMPGCLPCSGFQLLVTHDKLCQERRREESGANSRYSDVEPFGARGLEHACASYLSFIGCLCGCKNIRRALLFASASMSGLQWVVGSRVDCLLAGARTPRARAGERASQSAAEEWLQQSQRSDMLSRVRRRARAHRIREGACTRIGTARIGCTQHAVQRR